MEHCETQRDLVQFSSDTDTDTSRPQSLVPGVSALMSDRTLFADGEREREGVHLSAIE